MKPREHRHKVLARAQVRAGLLLPAEACVRDVSSRGMLIQSAFPPRRGTYVEIILARQTVTGRVIWSKGRRFGISTRERVDLGAIVSGFQGGPAPQAANHIAVRKKPSPGGRGALARTNGKMLEFGSLVVTALAMVAVAGALVQQTLGETVQAIMSNL